MSLSSVISNFFFEPRKIYPLVTFRVLFGLLMLFGLLRFALSGWIEKLYIIPQYRFQYVGFSWLPELSPFGIYALFIIAGLSAIGIAIGYFYRISAILFFICFTWIQLLDATNYLNHYYLVCLLALVLIFMPANKMFSLDVYFKRVKKQLYISGWPIALLITQLSLVYFFAGVAKLNSDWLFAAMPLRIWLPEHGNLFLLGSLFKQEWIAYFFSWFGAAYDLTIWLFLLYAPTRVIAYAAVIVFHSLTGLLFNIGLFPLIMISSTVIFFSGDFHEQIWTGLTRSTGHITNTNKSAAKPLFTKFAAWGIAAYFVVQVFLPLRHHLYPSNVLWTEEGYRFSWRVMVVEKSGQATFYVKDPKSGRQSEINNRNYLTKYQEKQMAIQPDFIQQYANWIAADCSKRFGIDNPIVTADVFVVLNGRPSKRFIDPTTDLANLESTLFPKSWIIH